MNIISSFRPVHECRATTARTMAAYRSWVGVFNRIVYFGSHCSDMSDPSVRFIASEQFPTVSSLVAFASEQPGWSAISNADIIIRGDLRRVVRRLASVGAGCAITWRHEFEGSSFRNAKVVDAGMDFFLANQETWIQVAAEYPEHYRFGHNQWDTIMLGAFNCVARRRCYDVTRARFCFHPKHQERRQVFKIDGSVDTRFRNSVFLPPALPY